MAMKKRYHTVNGMLIGETSNGVRRGYLPDALGSVVATVDNNGSIENTYRYKPYGSLLAKTGTAADPSFMWVGVLGYRRSDTRESESYNRLRHYGLITSLWSSIDPIWPREKQYAYVGCNPTNGVDPFGLSPVYVHICAFIGGWRAERGKRPYLGLSVPGLGVNTNDRWFGDDPLSCKLFAEITIDSCAIGKKEPKVSYSVGKTVFVNMHTLSILAQGVASPIYQPYGSGASGCRSFVAFGLSASIWTPFGNLVNPPPIVMRPVVEFTANNDTVTVKLSLMRTQFPDFEYRIHIDRRVQADRESQFETPESGLNAPLISELLPSVSGRAPTQACCKGTCPK